VACLAFDMRLRERLLLLRRVARIPVSMYMALSLANRLKYSEEFLHNPAAQRMQLSHEWYYWWLRDSSFSKRRATTDRKLQTPVSQKTIAADIKRIQ